MSDSYAKVFSSMYTGSMYGAGMHVFAVWGWVLAHKDENGCVEINAQLVANELGGDAQQVEEAITYLCAPDPNSRSKGHEGRRLMKESQFGYRVVNHHRYKDRGGSRAAYWRKYRAEQKKRATVAHVAQRGAPRHTDADTDVNTPPCAPPKGETGGGQHLFGESEASANGKVTFDYDSGQFGGITNERLAAWWEAYPAVDIDIEIKRAAIWLVDNPSKRKKQLGRFLSGWFSRTQERGGTKGVPPKREPKRGNLDWLPTEAEADEIFREAGVTQ